MITRSAERAARLLLIGLIAGFAFAPLFARWVQLRQAVELHGHIAEAGGWTPGVLTATAGQPLRLRLTSDDVVHGFAVGQSEWPAVDVLPGQMTETTLAFDRPGTYMFYCTRWCGLSHWRMRGVIEVSGPTGEPVVTTSPLYVSLGLDIDAPHPAAVTPEQPPSAQRGAQLGINIASSYLTQDYYRTHSPATIWQDLRVEVPELTKAKVWDLVALVWQSNTSPEALEEGQRLYAANCAACHGESGEGNGVMAEALAQMPQTGIGQATKVSVDFTDAASMLGASPALFQGKIIRGGMGTGMPYWGPIFTEAQTWALVDYLWTFQFETEHTP